MTDQKRLKKMKSVLLLCTVVIFAFSLGGCGSFTSTMLPTQTEQISIPTAITPTSTNIPSLIPRVTLSPQITKEMHTLPTITPTIKLLNTLESQKANDLIKTLLRNSSDCSAPCFWGITPGRTTVQEVESIFNHLGLKTILITYQGKDYYNVDYDLISGLSISINIPVTNNLVETMRITLVPDYQKAGNSQEWSAYSPETLVKRYGVPSRVDFAADWGAGSFFEMQMYFDAEYLIVEYSGQNIIPNQRGSTQICPLTAPFDTIRLWMGKNPVDPPGQGVSLEDVASLSLDKFSELMTADPNDACFIFDGNAIKY